MLCLVLGALVAGTSLAQDSVDSVLKQVSRATKGVRGVVADVEYAEIVGKRPIHGTGKVWVSFDGSVRAEIGGDKPRTLIFAAPYLYVHTHSEKTVEIYDVTFNPHMLGQYVLVGFVPSGKALKKSFDVALGRESTLAGRPVWNLFMTPKADPIAKAIARIELSIDPQSGFPVQHKIFHASGETRLEIRYLDTLRDDELSPSLFRPKWPAGTKTIKMAN